MRRRRVLAALAFVVLAACGRLDDTPTVSGPTTSTMHATTTAVADSDAGGPTPEPAPSLEATPAPTSAPAPTPAAGASGRGAPAARTPTASAAASPPGCPAPPPASAPRGDKPRYDLRVDVRLAENAVVGALRVRFTPDIATDRLVFRLWANAPRTARAGARLDVGTLLVEGRTVPAAVENPTTLVARPPGGLAAGEAVDVSLDWRLTLPGSVSDRISRAGDAVRLGHFFPILAWEPGVGWSTRPPTALYAEASVAPTADFDLHVSLPPGLTALASGRYVGGGRWSATDVREVGLSIGRFTLAGTTVRAPHPVEITVGVHAGIAESPASYLGRVARAVTDFAGRYGPYPWTTYTLAITPNLSGGIEYPGHVMQGPGTTGRTTSHEVAHMWFYGLVGNDQGRDPWIDEGLASFLEARFEGTLASMRSKPIPPDAKGRAGEPMTYWEQHASSYYRGVYVQGAQALAALGPVDRVDCALRHLAAIGAHRVVRNGDVIAAVERVFPDGRSVLARYGIRG